MTLVENSLSESRLLARSPEGLASAHHRQTNVVTTKNRRRGNESGRKGMDEGRQREGKLTCAGSDLVLELDERRQLGV